MLKVPATPIMMSRMTTPAMMVLRRDEKMAAIEVSSCFYMERAKSLSRLREWPRRARARAVAPQVRLEPLAVGRHPVAEHEIHGGGENVRLYAEARPRCVL